MKLNEEQIRHMVNRFLGYYMPENWQPDGGVIFEKFGNAGTAHQYERRASGTNLLDFEQAKKMVIYMAEGMPDAENPNET